MIDVADEDEILAAAEEGRKEGRTEVGLLARCRVMGACGHVCLLWWMKRGGTLNQHSQERLSAGQEGRASGMND